MGTTLRIEVEAPLAVALEASEAALSAVAAWESVLSTWDPGAELARVNRAATSGCAPLSPPLAEALAEAGRWVALTGGGFDPAIGSLVDAWDLRGAGRVPSPSELRSALRSSGWARVTLAPGPCLRLADGAWLDSGAFGKGLALRAALDSLRARGLTALLDFGGQVATTSPREVAAADPADRRRVAAVISGVTGSASTSSQSERHVVVDGQALGHLLDPRTGRTVPAWGSVTVVAADPLAADVLSTALFVLGADAALAWAAAHPGVGVLVLERTPAPRARWSAALDGRIALRPPFTPPGASRP